MKYQVPSIPLITVDPYFSVWSSREKLNETNTCLWTGKRKIMQGMIEIDGAKYSFMGQQAMPVIPQTDFSLSATSTCYTFQNDDIELKVRFTSPLLLSDLSLLSRPCSYIIFSVRSLNGTSHDVSVSLYMDEEHCYDGHSQKAMHGLKAEYDGFKTAFMGQKEQKILCHSGDDITIDWGYLYLSVAKSEKYTANTEFAHCPVTGHYGVTASASFSADVNPVEIVTVAAYDDIASINYFGDFLKGYWAKDGAEILDVITDSIQNCNDIIAKCDALDKEIYENALASGGESYALLCALSYRQTIAAHKLIADRNGDVLFISKECFSNGCAATADVSYPSTPLYLLYAPELVKGMMRPILKFANLPVWTYDFAPHDAGRYPHITGQVYGINGKSLNGQIEDGDVHIPYYQLPKEIPVYDFKYQMPVEECGNMLIMAAAVAVMENNADFSLPHMELFRKWAGYLEKFGTDPGEQLCTDDFAGHLAHNVNLSAKAIMGLEAFSILLRFSGDSSESEKYHKLARDMAESWKTRADAGDHTRLAFDLPESWSLKYNLIWDILFGSNFFPESFYQRELDWYSKMQNQYGVPLDNRDTYTKSDWILWVSAFSSNPETVEAFSKPLTAFLADTPNKVPFSDWYDTVSARQVAFQNRTVQGGLFMPILRRKLSEKLG